MAIMVDSRGKRKRKKSKLISQLMVYTKGYY